MTQRNTNTGMNERIRNLEELVITMGTALRNQMQQETPHRQPDVLELIAKYKPPSYKGQEDPTTLEDWIRAFDKIYAATRYDEPQKVTAAAYYLEGTADVWWQNHQRLRDEMPDYSWEEFKVDLRERFYHKYSSSKIRGVHAIKAREHDRSRILCQVY